MCSHSIHLHVESWKRNLCDAALLQECHVNHTWHNLLFYFNHQHGHVYQPIAVQLCKSQSHDTFGVLLEAGGGGWGGAICSHPNEIDVPPSISVGTAAEEAQRAGTHSGLVDISLLLSRLN